MSEADGLLFAYVLDGRGGGQPLEWDGVRSWTPDQGVLWVHLDRTGGDARSWVENETGIDPATAAALLTPAANRPRVQRVGDGLLVVLRGANLNPDDNLDDMVGLHLWIDAARIITLRRRRLMVGAEIQGLVEGGTGPKGPSDFLSVVADRLMQPIGPVIDEFDDRVDRLQSELLESSNASLRTQLRAVRQEAINFRRYLAPQRDALSRFQTEQPTWLENLDRAYLRETADRTLRFVEDLDSIRERAAITQDELNNRLTDQMNRTMYLLTIVAALLLPPSLLTGLFGINVAGMPGTETPWAFATIAVIIPVLAVIEFVVLRWLKWI